MAKFERSRPHVNIGTIGAAEHGKTTLTAAIAKVLREAQPALNPAPASGEERTPAAALPHIEYQTKARHYAHVDCPGGADRVKDLLAGASQMDGAILVVDATEGVTPQTREHVLLARHSGVARIVVALNKADLVEEEEFLDQVEEELREVLAGYEFDGHGTSFVRVSALKAFKGDKAWGERLLGLVKAVDESIPTPERATAKPFMMPVEDVFTIAGRGTAVTGRVERGVLKAGEKVDFIGLTTDYATTTATGLETFGKQLDEAHAGEYVSLLVRDLKPEDLQRGQYAVKHGSLTPPTRFEASVHLLSEDEGGRSTPVGGSLRAQFHFRTSEVTGAITLDSGTGTPGANVTMTVKLLQPVVMEEGLRFVIREGDRTVGVGHVDTILK
ncbi:elongation factor Tu [Streptomyces griseofuscus]|uniref:elongation factor Tu n=1 Tax=Streptomyces griseofuscus TaxID=146922 RepID=UPI0036CE7CF7